MNIHSAMDEILLRENFYNIFVPSLSRQKNQSISIFFGLAVFFCLLYQYDTRSKGVVTKITINELSFIFNLRGCLVSVQKQAIFFQGKAQGG